MFKNTNKYNQRHFFKFIIIYSLYLTYLLINTKPLESPSQNPISQRQLEIKQLETIPDRDISTDALLNQTNMTSDNNTSSMKSDNPFLGLTAYYMIFIMTNNLK